MNILDYLRKYKDKTFEEMPFNEIDSLILSEMAYLNLHLYAPLLEDHDFIKLQTMRIYNEDHFSYGSVDAKKNLKMIDLMKYGERFKTMQIGLCKEKFREGDKSATQFFAVTYILPDDTMYIAFRGTDITINGWKEDFHMVFMDTIPSQRDALTYINHVLERYGDRKFYIGGHSKGGNLAFYCAFNLDNKKWEKNLIHAYSFDGPGFKNGVKDFPSYERVKDRISKYMTHRDWVGMIYNNFRRQAIIVAATGFLLGGHDPFSWHVNLSKIRFVKARRSRGYKNSELAFNRWIRKVSDEDKILACDVIFELLKDAKTVYDLPKAVGKVLFHGKEMLSGYSDEEKKRVLKIVKKLLKSYTKTDFSYKRAVKKIEKKDKKNE